MTTITSLRSFFLQCGQQWIQRPAEKGYAKTDLRKKHQRGYTRSCEVYSTKSHHQGISSSLREVIQPTCHKRGQSGSRDDRRWLWWWRLNRKKEKGKLRSEGWVRRKQYVTLVTNLDLWSRKLHEAWGPPVKWKHYHFYYYPCYVIITLLLLLICYYYYL